LSGFSPGGYTNSLLASRVPFLPCVAHLDRVAQDGQGRHPHDRMQQQLLGVVRGRAFLEDEAVIPAHDAEAADSVALCEPFARIALAISQGRFRGIHDGESAGSAQWALASAHLSPTLWLRGTPRTHGCG